MAGVIADAWRYGPHLRDHVRTSSREPIHLVVQAEVRMDAVVSNWELDWTPFRIATNASAHSFVTGPVSPATGFRRGIDARPGRHPHQGGLGGPCATCVQP